MKVSKFLSSILLMVFVSLAAQAKDRVLVPAFNIKFANHTSIPTAELTAMVKISCSYKSGWWWPETKSCGDQELNLKISEDGTLAVPNLMYQSNRPQGNHTVGIILTSPAAKNGYVTSIQFSGSEIDNLTPNMQSVSLYGFQALHLNIKTPTGENYAQWRGIIKNSPTTPCVRVQYSWSIPGHHAPDVMGDLIYDSNQTDSDFETAADLKATYILYQGDLGAAPVAHVDLFYVSYKQKQCDPAYQGGDENRFSVVTMDDTLSNAHKVISESVIHVK
jgi:hypothetical protein